MLSADVLQDPKMSEFLRPPSCCEQNIMHSMPAKMQPLTEVSLIIGGKGAKCQLHRDPVTWIGWNYLVLGKKRWHFFPPSTSYQSLCAEIGPWASGTSPADSFKEDAEHDHLCTFPSEVWEATQEMGDVLLIPPGWWHQTLHEDRTLSIMSQYITDVSLSVVAEHAAACLDSRSSISPLERQGDPRESLVRIAEAMPQTVRPDRRATLRSFTVGVAAPGSGGDRASSGIFDESAMHDAVECQK